MLEMFKLTSYIYIKQQKYWWCFNFHGFDHAAEWRV